MEENFMELGIIVLVIIGGLLLFIEIDKLKKDLIDIKYDALTRSSELMEKSRQSRIEEYISTEDSPLQTATNRPYLIKKD